MPSQIVMHASRKTLLQATTPDQAQIAAEEF
jgi:hypothetical protein